MLGKAWYLYILECKDGSLYTGIATDIEKRFLAHASGKGARYTKAHPPARVRAALEFPDRASASRAEYAVKQLKAAEKHIFLSCLPVYT